MDKRKIFIGNLDFNINENELKRFLSGYGSVLNLKLYQKKGYAFAEMSTEEEASAAVKKLDGINFKNREIRASLMIKKNKARSVTARRFREKGAALSAKKRSEESLGKKRNDESRGSSRSKPVEGGRGFVSSGSRPGTGYKSGNSRSSGYGERFEEGTDERRRGFRSERDSRDKDGGFESGRPERKGWIGKPAYSSKSSRYGSNAGDEYDDDSGRGYERRRSSSGGGYPGGFKREKGGSAGSQIRVWTASKPAGSRKREDAPERGRPEKRTDSFNRKDTGDSSEKINRTRGGGGNSSRTSGASSVSNRGGAGRRNVANPSGRARGGRNPKGRPGKR